MSAAEQPLLKVVDVQSYGASPVQAQSDSPPVEEHAKVEELEVTVTRGSNGKLGLALSRTNIVIKVDPGPCIDKIRVGDKILSVNTVQLHCNLLLATIVNNDLQRSYTLRIARFATPETDTSIVEAAAPLVAVGKPVATACVFVAPGRTPTVVYPAVGKAEAMLSAAEPFELRPDELLRADVRRQRGGVMASASYTFAFWLVDPDTRREFSATASGGFGARMHDETGLLLCETRRTTPWCDTAGPTRYECVAPDGELLLRVTFRNGMGQRAPADFSVDLPSAGARLRNAPPGWDAERQTHTLDFGGLAGTASCKNCMLCLDEAFAPRLRCTPAQPSVQTARFVFGKTSYDQVKNSFRAHWRQPFSYVQAFALTLILFAESAGGWQ